MSAIVSEMDGGWREIVWKKERCGVGGGCFYLVKLRVVGVIYQRCVIQGGVKLTWPGKVEKCELDF